MAQPQQPGVKPTPIIDKPIPETTPMLGTTPIVRSGIELAGDPGLPPAGYKRDDELARRQDDLDQKIDAFAQQKLLFKMDKDAFDEDAEILKHYQRNAFTGEQGYFAAENLDHEHFAYKQVNWMSPAQHAGIAVAAAKADGWLFATHDVLNLSNGRPIVSAGSFTPHIGYSNAIQVGDTILMMMPRHKYEAMMAGLDLAEQDYENRMRALVVGAGPGLADRPDIRERLIAAGSEEMAPVNTLARQMLAKNIADNQFADQLRNGTVAGAQVGR